MRKEIQVVLTVAGIVGSLLVYVYTTFATVDYVKQYVDVRHQIVLERLNEIRDTLNKITWEKK